MALFAYLMEKKQNFGPHLVIVPNAGEWLHLICCCWCCCSAVVVVAAAAAAGEV
jgi:hypothetical protein